MGVLIMTYLKHIATFRLLNINACICTQTKNSQQKQPNFKSLHDASRKVITVEKTLFFFFKFKT